jgi:Carboxypeptidase regulatory-like domain/TonB dependent receptor
MKWLKASVLAWACMTAVSIGFAQTDRGTITGTISDPAGAVVAQAKIAAKNTATGANYQVGSSATGNYTLPQLPAGNYEMTVSVQGFKTFIRTNIQVAVAGTLRIDVPLEVGATSDSVTVSEAAPLLKTESGELSHNVSTDRLNNLPAITLGSGVGVGNIRNPLQVVTLLPGTQFSSDNTLRVNGLPSSSQAIRIEGQDATNGITRQFSQATQAGLDAIQEVAVQTSNYAAEFGQAGGGYFNYTMKSGSNQFHGSAYDYFVNEFLHAGTPFTARTGARSNEHLRNVQRRNDYGFTVGGPIVIPGAYDGHDKSFFFFNFEQFRENQNISTGLATVPTTAYRNGDFSAALIGRLTIAGQPASDAAGTALFQNQIFDPASNRTAPDGTTVRDPFVGNVIPLSRIDPVVLKIQAMLPTANFGAANATINNYAIPAYKNFRTSTIPSFKLDHNVSSTLKLSGYYGQTRIYSPQANGFAQVFTNTTVQDSVTHTIRLNLDKTVTPTTLLHVGGGLLHLSQPLLTPKFDQSTLGWTSNFANPNAFPYMFGYNDAGRGGLSQQMGAAFLYDYTKNVKPTFNAYITNVRGNHTIKAGAEGVFEGLQVSALSRTQGNFVFAAQQSGNPWEDAKGLNSTTGFPYASFLLGRSNSLIHAAPANGRLGNHQLGFYVQDTWKVTRKFTLDYGLRYDYVTLLREQYGRMQNAAFNTPNPVAGNRLGMVIYEATCKCKFNNNYPWAFGPRLGAAYQINDKTVLRAGFGIAYGTSPTNQNLSASIGDNYTLTPSGYGEAAAVVRNGNPYGVGNPFGNQPVTWPDFRPNYPYEAAPGVRPPTSPFISIDRHSGRPPRIAQWSIGLQRELGRNLVIEGSYVGNRGVWWTAPLLAAQNYNALTFDSLRNLGLDINSATDRALLSARISSPQVIARFPSLANPDTGVYPGFPSTQPLNQALRPYPQWAGISSFLGPPLGVTWYDSFQGKLTKRFSHGLSLDSAFTWQKELNLGVSSDTTYLQPSPNLINDVYNYRQNKQISGFSRPLMMVISLNYTTPALNKGDNFASKVLSVVTRDWTLGGVFRYQSGQVIRTPPSANGLFAQMVRNQSPATFGGGTTFWNRVEGQNPLLFDPNCGCFDPTTQLVLNKAAWTDAPAGQFGTSAPYYNDVRWQRQPAESMSFGRVFQVNKEGRMKLSVRAEFQNIFNRLFLANPQPVLQSGLPGAATNPSTPTVTAAGTGALSNGYGFVNTFNGGAAQPRNGQIVARFTF